MITTYHLNVNELSIELLNSIKAAFKDKTIEITVSEVVDETEYLLASAANKQNLEASMQELAEGKGIPFTLNELQEKYKKIMKTITFSPLAIKDLDEWRNAEPKILAKIISLITEIASNPFAGTGKPEPLKHELKGKWSRRINQEHRLVYEVLDTTIIIISCRYHY